MAALIVFLVIFAISVIPDGDSVWKRIGILAAGAIALASAISTLFAISEIVALVIAGALSILLYFISQIIRWQCDSGSVVAVLITSVLCTIAGVLFVEGAVGYELGDLPFVHGIALAIPVVVGMVALFYSVENMYMLGDPYGLWDHLKRIGWFLLTPAAIVAAIVLVCLIIGALAIGMVAAVIAAIAGCGGILVIVFRG